MRSSSSSDRGGFLITADLHGHAWREGSTLIDGVNSRLLDLLSILDQIDEYAIDHRVSRLLVLGDVFHLKKNIPEQVRNLVFEGLRKLSRDMSITFLAGNHDREVDRDDCVTILPFRAFATVITDLTTVGTGREVYVPWFYDQEQIRGFLAALKGSWEFLFYHGEVKDGLAGPTDYKLTDSPLEVDRLGQFREIFAGHLHKRQLVHKRVWYPGNPLPKDWGELELDKGILHRTADGKVLTVPLRSPSFVSVQGSTLKSATRGGLGRFAGNFVRLILDELPSGEEVEELRVKAKARSVLIKPAPKSIPLRPPGDSGDRVTREFDDVLREYVVARGVPEEDREGYVGYARKVIQA